MTTNEGALCEAVIRLTEREAKAERDWVRFPELDFEDPPVDCRFGIAVNQYAVEHTIVEPFSGQIRSSVDFEAFARPLVEALDGGLPVPGTYLLHFPIDPTADRPRWEHPTLRAAIVSWVQEAAAEMHAEAPAREERDTRPMPNDPIRKTEIESLPLTLERSLSWAQSDAHDGRLFVDRFVADDIEPLRMSRLAIALEKKLPKLSNCRDQGALTILVLENRDLALTNHILIAQALEELLANRPDAPDRIIIADTTSDPDWTLWLATTNGEIVLDAISYVDVDATTLVAAPLLA